MQVIVILHICHTTLFSKVQYSSQYLLYPILKIKKEVSILLTKSKYFSNLLTTIITNVLRIPQPYKIRVLMPFCLLLVALPKLLKTPYCQFHLNYIKI